MGKNQIESSNNNSYNNDEENSNGKRKRISNSSSNSTCNCACAVMADDEHQHPRRYRLSDVVLDCTNRWFQETLKEARNGDVNMQIILSQMYYNGYGVPKDPKKGKTWITRASRVRSSVVKISHKHPGYNASDSDSDDMIIPADKST